MLGLVYASRASVPFDERALRELAERSAAKNALLGVTGYLCFRSGRFLQYLEGEPQVVSSLMETIARDPRHVVLRRLDLDAREMRLFPTWHMRHVSGAALHEIQLEGVVELVLQQMSAEVYGEERTRRLATDLVGTLARFRARPELERG